MTRLLVPLATPDISGFTKTLKGFLDERHAVGKPLPSHVELLNLLSHPQGRRLDRGAAGGPGFARRRTR